MPPARILFWAATLGCIVLSLRSTLAGPPSLEIAVACVVAYLAIVVSGVLVLRLRMFADALVRGPSDARGVVLTFDDGPDPKYTREVLDLLDARHAKATFFVIGRKVDAHPEVIREIARRGHDIGI